MTMSSVVWGEPEQLGGHGGLHGGHHEPAGLMTPNIWGGGAAAAAAQSWQSGMPPSAAGGVPPGGGFHAQQHHQQQQSGWGNPGPGAPSAGTANWGIPPNPQQQPPAWGGQSGASPGGASYSEAARKGVPPTQPAPQPIRQARPSYDQTGSGQGWGQQAGPGTVDQGTPWDVGATNPGQSNEWRSDGTSHWGEPGRGGAPAQAQQRPPPQPSGWGQPAPPPNPQAYAQPDNRGFQQQRDNGTGQWGARQPSAAAPSGGSDGWGQPNPNANAGSSGWGAPPPAAPQQQPAAPQNWDPNPQNPSMWQAPNANEHRDDMMWHDPNPKQKKVAADKGTSLWGDPQAGQQAPIQRWKDPSSDDIVKADSLSTPSSSQPRSTWEGTPVDPAPVSKSTSLPAPTGWGAEGAPGGPMAAPPPRPPVASEWGTPSTDAPATTGWGEPPKTSPNGMIATVRNEWAASTVQAGASWEVHAEAFKESQRAKGGSGMVTSINSMENQSAANSDVFSSGAITSVAPSVTQAAAGALPNVLSSLQAQQNAAGGAGAGAAAGQTNLRDLTHQIAEQLRIAVQKGLININILNQPLPQNVLLTLNQLLQRVPRLESANKELAQLRAQPQQNPKQQQEAERLQADIEKLNQEIKSYQQRIQQETPPGAMKENVSPDSTQAPGDGAPKSKLQEWAGKNNKSWLANGEVDGKLGGSASTPTLDTLDTPFKNLTIGSDNNPWSSISVTQAGADWGAPRVTNGAGKTSRDGTQDSSPDKNGAADLSSFLPNASSNSTSATPTIEDTVKEFIPGKKWDWKDPKEVEQDPNATPGNSLKPNPLSVGSHLGTLGGVGGGQMSGMGMFGGTITPTKVMEQPRASTGVSPSMPGDIWNPTGVGMRSRPPTHTPFPSGPAPGGLGNPVRLGNYNRSVSSPGQSAFAPYGHPVQPPTWALFTNVQQVDESRLRNILKCSGNVLFASHQPIRETGYLMARFGPDTPLDRVIPMLQQQCQPFGVKVQPMNDVEAERFVRGPQQPAPMMPPTVPSGMWGEPSAVPNPHAGGWGNPQAPPFSAGPMGVGDLSALPPHGPFGGGGAPEAFPFHTGDHSQF